MGDNTTMAQYSEFQQVPQEEEPGILLYYWLEEILAPRKFSPIPVIGEIFS